MADERALTYGLRLRGTPVRDTTHASGPAPGWQQRRSGVDFYFCCCPFMMLLAPFILVARLVQYGTLRLLGRPVVSPWTRKS